MELLHFCHLEAAFSNDYNQQLKISVKSSRKFATAKNNDRKYLPAKISGRTVTALISHVWQRSNSTQELTSTGVMPSVVSSEPYFLLLMVYELGVNLNKFIQSFVYDCHLRQVSYFNMLSDKYSCHVN